MKNLLQKYQITTKFEKMLAKYTGAPYVVAVDCCTNALLLCFAYSKTQKITLPKDTYVGVAMAALHAKKHINFEDINWKGIYRIGNTNIIDAAKRLTSKMYIKKTNMCLSFHYKKHLKIGRGGAILTDNKKFYEWCIKARNNGKDINQPLPVQKYNIIGYNMILHPMLAQYGIELLRKLPRKCEDLPVEHYGDLSKQLKSTHS